MRTYEEIEAEVFAGETYKSMGNLIWRAKRAEAREIFKEEFRVEEYNDLQRGAFNMVWDTAWNEHHDEGFDAVVGYFHELYDFAIKFRKLSHFRSGEA